eukprot:scaffold662_cov364-Pavlova_lutheri.AAC.53
MDGHECEGDWDKITSVAFKVDTWTNRERKCLRISSGTVFVHFLRIVDCSRLELLYKRKSTKMGHLATIKDVIQ